MQSAGGRVVIGRDARPEASGLEVVVRPVKGSTVAGAGLTAGVRHVMVDVAPVRRDLATRATAMAVEGPDLLEKRVVIDEAYVVRMLADIVKNEDLSRYIL